jgi:hypothetical protein
VNTAEFNQRALGIRKCESAFHLASTILGGRDIIEEFVAARVWPISSGWVPTEIVHLPKRSTGLRKRCLSRSSGLNMAKIKVLTPSWLR